MNRYLVMAFERGESRVPGQRYAVLAGSKPHARRLAGTAFATEFGVPISCVETESEDACGRGVSGLVIVERLVAAPRRKAGSR